MLLYLARAQTFPARTMTLINANDFAGRWKLRAVILPPALFPLEKTFANNPSEMRIDASPALMCTPKNTHAQTQTQTVTDAAPGSQPRKDKSIK